MSLRVYVVAGGVVLLLANSVSAQPDAQRWKAIEGDLRAKQQETLQALLPRDEGTLEGSVLGGADVKIQIGTPEGRSLMVANPDSLRNLPEGVPFEFTVKRTEAGVQVSQVELMAISRWDESKGKLPIGDYQALHVSFDELKETVKESLQKGAMSGDLPDLRKKFGAVEKETVRAYSRTDPNDTETREFLCDRFVEMRDLRLKAQFGREDNYWPEVYEKIHKNSQSAVAIARRGRNEPFGSGVLIGKSLVLTCRHVANRFVANQLEVWFDYETTSAGERSKSIFPVKSVVLEGKPLATGQNPLDFALLELDPNAAGDDAHRRFAPAVLGEADCARDDAIYVIGHPAGRPRMVHDNAFVLFPFRTNSTGMTELQMLVCHEIRTSPGREDELQQFLDSFVEVVPGQAWEQYSRRWSLSPVIAADCDTAHGNSGSGAFDRTTNRLIGILFAGEYDLGPSESYVAGWRRHEAILPIKVILQQADKQLPSWRMTYEVEVQ